VRDDVLDDFTTVEMARDAYGVIFTDERALAVDEEATQRRREEMRAARDGHLRSLTEMMGGETQMLMPSRSPSTEAGNRAFGLA
jgi:hypothetical protein